MSQAALQIVKISGHAGTVPGAGVERAVRRQGQAEDMFLLGRVEDAGLAFRVGCRAERRDERVLRVAAVAASTTGDLFLHGDPLAVVHPHDDGAAAGDLYREAIERLRRTRLRPEVARAHLLYGEWLRRENRRADAREQLRTAHEILAAIGMEAFAERARRELQATGEKVRKRTVDTRDDLTAQERQIARLARDGLSNPEIGARLFLSPRTVEWHLRNVFTKLGIRSRRELANALTGPDSQLFMA